MHNTYILHPGMDCTNTTISQNYYWPKVRDDICTHIMVFRTVNNNKKQSLKQKLLSAKEAEAIPWDISTVDHVSPYKIRREGHDDPIIQKDLSMIYQATGWYNKQAATTENLENIKHSYVDT